jgi:hypothetical protein
MTLLLKLCSWISNSVIPRSPPMDQVTALSLPMTQGCSREGVETGQYPPATAVKQVSNLSDQRKKESSPCARGERATEATESRDAML